jgi:hypothetical protein
MEITQDQYLKALDILDKVELAQKAVEAFEEQKLFEENPIFEIMQKGKVQFIEGEVIRENPLLWRATRIHYIHEKGTVERLIEYASKPTDNCIN